MPIAVHTINGKHRRNIVVSENSFSPVRLPAARLSRSRDAEARIHNFMIDDAAYRLHRDNDFCRLICIIEQSEVPRRDI